MKNVALVSSLVALFGVASAAAQSQSHESADRSLVLLGESGRVAPDQELDVAVVVGGSLVIEGVVHGPAAAIGGSLDVRPGAIVENGVYAIGGTLRIDEGARVEGARTQVASGDFSEVIARLSADRQEHAASMRWVGPILRFAQVLAVFLIGLLLVMLAPRHIQTVRLTLERQPSKAALAGLVLILGFVPVCVLLAISLLGIPLIPLAILTLMAASVMGLTALAATVGYRFPLIKSPDNLTGALALGMLVVAIATLVPLLGGVLWFLASFYAAGAVFVSRFGTRSPPLPPASAPAHEADVGAELPASARH